VDNEYEYEDTGDESYEPEIEETRFTVSTGGETQTIEGRAEAIAQAKALSLEHGRVSVERVDGRVHMQFSGGSLDSFVWELRPTH